MAEHGNRTTDRWWFRAVIVAVIGLGIAQAGATWRLTIVAENDIKHLTLAVKTMQADIRELFRRAYWTDE